jgi:hypothetical protein
VRETTKHPKSSKTTATAPQTTIDLGRAAFKTHTTHTQQSIQLTTAAMSILTRKTAIIAAAACGCVVLSLGITALVLGVKGYFAFEDPCMDIKSFEIVDIDIQRAEGGNPFLDVLDTFTFGMASQVVPAQATMVIEMILEVNNTNPYDLDYQQGDEGLLEIPLEEGNGTLKEDLVVGSWTVPSSTLKANARNDIPVSVTTTIDLLSADTVGLATKFATGQTLVFRIRGGIEGSSWVPGVRGTSSFLCLAHVEDIMDFESGTTVKCTHSTKAGKFIQESGEFDFFAFDDDEVDSSCFV